MHIKGNGIDKTFDKYSKEIDFILKTGENTIIQNNVNMQTVALSFINIREILQKIYNQIFPGIKKEFTYRIDFMRLTCTKNKLFFSCETHQCPFFMETIFTGSSRIYM